MIESIMMHNICTVSTENICTVWMNICNHTRDMTHDNKAKHDKCTLLEKTSKTKWHGMAAETNATQRNASKNTETSTET